MRPPTAGRCRAPVLVTALLLLLAAGGAARGEARVAVFNFQMKSDTPDWKWLEKGLSDRIATDFCQDRGIAVVARDEMQALAETLAWVPELATDAKASGLVKTQLKAETIVTGVYAVEGAKITLTGQIIEVEGRREVARKELSGAAADVLELQRRLSAELLSVVVNKPAAQILPQLPVWTRSLPAAKAVYEGMDLYDQGRYAEAWLKFRQASKADAAYMEAQYWVGKMYYFLHRYAHAQRAIEKFVYLDTVHPRVGDAMVEYVHIVEAAGASPETLLKLYEDLAKRFPNALVWQGAGWGRMGLLRSDQWFHFKRIHLLSDARRHEEVVRQSGAVLGASFWQARREEGCAFPYGLVSLMAHHARTGQLPSFKVEFMNDDAHRGWEADEANPRYEQWVAQRWVHFDASGGAQAASLKPFGLAGAEVASRSREMTGAKPEKEVMVGLRAPNGYVFRSLVFQAQVEGDDGRLEVRVRRPDNLGVLNRNQPAAQGDLREAAGKGLRYDSPPGLSLLVAECKFSVNGPQSGPVLVKGISVKATLARLQGAAALDVSCENTPDFRVYVDDVPWRWQPGVVGPLTPGTHKVRLVPAAAGTPYGEWSTTVTLKAGDVAAVIGRLPWAEPETWKSWRSIPLEAAATAPSLGLYRTDTSPPALQADDAGIRLVWSVRGDLWSSVSTEGERFSPPRKLDLPVSSGWNEFSPRLAKDESGRFVLVFLSDRDATHRNLPYICWSRDFVHWSNPSQVGDESAIRIQGLMVDDRGRLILDCGAGTDRRLLVSADGLRWQSEKMPGDLLTQDATGRFCAYGLKAASKESSPGFAAPLPCKISCWKTGDLHRWPSEEVLATTELAAGSSTVRLAVLEGDAGPVLLGLRDGLFQAGMLGDISLWQPDAAGQWQAAGRLSDLLPGPAAAVRHPRWGYVFAALGLEGHEWWPGPVHGPYVLRGPDLRPLRGVRNPPPSLGRKDEAAPPKRTSVADKILPNKITLGWDAVGKPFRSIGDYWKRPVITKAPVGELAFVRAFRERQGFLEGSRHFRVPSPGCGTVHPDARIVTFDVGGRQLAVALDAEKPDAANYDIARLDLTGKGDFRNAIEIPRIYLSARTDKQGRKHFEYEFVNDVSAVSLGWRPVAAGLVLRYEEGATLGAGAAFMYGFSTCAVGECRFGDKVYKVRFYDDTNNLDIRDPVRPRWDGRIIPLDAWAYWVRHGRRRDRDGRTLPALDALGDSFFVDCHEDGAKVIKYTNVAGDVFKYAGKSWVINRERIPSASYGQPILIDGQWWTVRVSDDGGRVVAEPYMGPMAYIRLDHPFWRMRLLAKDTLLLVSGGPGPVPVPAGQYYLAKYEEYLRCDPDFTSAKLSVDPQGVTFDLKPGTMTPIALGSPLRLKLSVTQKDESLRFEIEDEQDVSGRGAAVDKYSDRGSSVTPHLKITLAGGGRSEVFEVNHVYEARDRGWKIPPGVTGTFTVTAEILDSFPVVIPPVTVTIR